MSSIFRAATAAVLAFLALALVAAAGPAVGKEDRPAGIGWLTDFCDDDWDIKAPFWFVGNCDNATSRARNIMSIEVSECFGVLDNGQLAIDNWHTGGMREKCKDCTRAFNDAANAPFMCKCQRRDGDYVWAQADLDDALLISSDYSNVCCGEWWGGPTCGMEGEPDLLSGRRLPDLPSHDG